MNSVQKNFRKQMKKAKKQGYLPESYEARRRGNIFIEHKKGFAGAGLVGVLIFCWNIFALGTWVNAFFHGGSSLSAAAVNPVNSNQKFIHEYLSNNEETQKEISTSIKMLSDIYSKKASYSEGDISSQYIKLFKSKSTIDTNVELLKPLKSLYTQEYNLAEQGLDFAANNYGKELTQREVDYINGIINQSNQINLQKNNIYIELFKAANMKYTVMPDGKINYQ
ncbi:MAG: hypothetical protein ACM3X7_07400 [Solirubrobacterales bacterium]